MRSFLGFAICRPFVFPRESFTPDFPISVHVQSMNPAKRSLFVYLLPPLVLFSMQAPRELCVIPFYVALSSSLASPVASAPQACLSSLVSHLLLPVFGRSVYKRAKSLCRCTVKKRTAQQKIDRSNKNQQRLTACTPRNIQERQATNLRCATSKPPTGPQKSI